MSILTLTGQQKKRFLYHWVGLFLPVWLAFFVLAEALERQTVVVTVTRIVNDARRHVSGQKMIVSDDLREVVEDLQVLVANRNVLALLQGAGGHVRDDIYDLFDRFCDVKHNYARISLIDTREKILCRKVKGQPVQVADRDLSTEAVERAFDGIILGNLTSDEVRLAAFELALSAPDGTVHVKKVVRAGAPVFDGGGRRLGMVAVNFIIDKLLTDIRDSSTQFEGSMHLIDEMGRPIQLSEPDPAQPVTRPIPPAICGAMGRMSDELPLFHPTEGLFVFDRISLFQDDMQSTGKIYDNSTWLDRDSKVSWTIASWLPWEQIEKELAPIRYRYRRLLMIFSAVLLALTGILGYTAVKRKKAETDLADQLRQIEYEIAIARRVIESMLPRIAPDAFPGLAFAVHYSPAGGTVGGDYYDLLPSGDRTAFLVFDVIGHGVSAALNTALARYAFHARLAEVLPPAETLARVNADLLGNIGEDRFITGFLGLIDPTRRTVRFANAASPPPLLVRASGAIERLQAEGMFLGCLPDLAYATGERELAPGDCIVVFTDGLIEHRNVSRELFGEARLLAAVRTAGPVGAKGLLDAVLADLRAFAGGTPATDDVTLVVIQVA